MDYFEYVLSSYIVTFVFLFGISISVYFNYKNTKLKFQEINKD